MKTLLSFLLRSDRRPEHSEVGTFRMFSDGEPVVFPKVGDTITVNHGSDPIHVIIQSIVKRYENELQAEYTLNVALVKDKH